MDEFGPEKLELMDVAILSEESQRAPEKGPVCSSSALVRSSVTGGLGDRRLVNSVVFIDNEV